MPADLRKVSLLAIVLLVVLRVSIGWHLMYEGLWKLSTQRTATPWTAEGYLKNSTGPLRSTFRAMTGDPDDLNWLNYDLMWRKWQDWQQRFATHYQLDGDQKSKLENLLTGPESFEVDLAALPPGLDLTKVSGVDKQAIQFDAESKQLIVDGKKHLLPSEQDRLVAAARKIADSKPEAKKTCDQFIAAVTRIYKISSRLAFREKLEALLKQDPDRVGLIIQTGAEDSDDEGSDAKGGSAYVVKVGEVPFYKELIARFEQNYARAHTKSEWDHIERQWKELQDKRRQVVGPIQALESELQASAKEMLTQSQLALGPLPEPTTPIRQINWRTMWGLTIFGFLLIIGLGTRLSALGGAFLLMMFYLAMPPWPYVQEIPSIEHNLFINKVSVEMVALLAIAAMPTGRWFGFDAILSALLSRRRGAESK